MISVEAAESMTKVIFNQINNLFAGDEYWALQEMLRAYCRYGCPEEFIQEVAQIIGSMSPQTTLEQAARKLEHWAEDRLRKTSN